MGSYSIFITSGIVWVVLYVVFHMSMQKMGCFNARRGEIIPFLVCICISRHSLRTDLFSWVGGIREGTHYRVLFNFSHF